MDKNIPVSEIMTSELITIMPNNTMKDVEEIFEKHKFHYLPVVEDDQLLGVISKSDYLAFKRKFNSDNVENRMDLFRLKKFKVKDVMTKHYVALDLNATLNDALGHLRKNYFHALPILSKGKLVGVLTTHDVIEYFAKLS